MTTQDEIAALKQATRECHEALTDVKAAMKDMKILLAHVADVKADLVLVSESVFDERIAETIQKRLDDYEEAMEINIDRATNAVYERFDVIGRILLGKGKPGDLEVVTANAAQDGQLPIIQRP